MRPAPDVALAVAFVLTLAALPLAAQGGASGAQTAAVDFRTPDGSRFVLLPDATMRHVEWAVATPADPSEDEPGLEGLGAAVAQASLGGTWTTGSIDAARERAAYERLDVAWAQLFASKGSAAAQAELQAAQQEAAALGDTRVFRRVLAALPVHQPEVRAAGPTTVLSLTTVPEALDDVAALVLERREQQALRDLPRIWTEEFVARQRLLEGDVRRGVHAELVALALPGHPVFRAFERAGGATPRRQQALDAWAATQHPSRSVHVLIGNFDSAALRALLEARFAATTLPRPPERVEPAVRPIASERRSSLPGCRENLVALAWQVPAGPAGKDPMLLRALARWLCAEDGPVPTALRAAKRSTRECRALAPWPDSLADAKLLVVEVRADDVSGLADLVLAACRAAAAGPNDAAAQRLVAALDLAAATVAADPRWRARELAEQLLRWPGQPILRPVADRVDARALRELSRQVFDGRPVIVEGRR